MKTGEVNAAIRRHYKTDEYAVMFEVGNKTGASVRRHADAVVMNLWPSRGLLIEGIEVKVTRSDWRREIENPEKAELISQYCDKWWIIAPEGIVQEHEVPALWGWMTASDKGLRVRKAAPQKSHSEITPLDRGFVAAMLRRASSADADMIAAMVEKRVAEREGKISEIVAQQVNERTRAFAKIEEKAKALKEAGLDLNGWEDASTIISYYELGRRLRHKLSVANLNYILGQLDSSSSAIREVIEIFNGESKMDASISSHVGGVQ